MSDATARPVVQLDHVTVTYGKQAALRDVVADFDAGAVGLLGPNGAGKSTLLKALLGFVRPDTGSMRVLDLNVTERPLEIRTRIGYMPESDAHIPGMNAVTFVAYWRAAGRIAPDQRDAAGARDAVLRPGSVRRAIATSRPARPV